MERSLRNEAIKAAAHSHSPYSRAQVGASLETQDGSIYSGCNIENSSFGGTVCAERVAIWKAVSEGHKKLKKIYVYTEDGWPPCAICLQVMTEFSPPELEVVFSDKAGNETKKLLSELLPNAFTPDHLKK